MSIQLAIELKDAYAPSWGFSRWDLAAGSIGSFWPVAQYYSESADAINFKFSYFKRSNISWDLNSQRDRDNKFVWIDDYDCSDIKEVVILEKLLLGLSRFTFIVINVLSDHKIRIILMIMKRFSIIFPKSVKFLVVHR